MGLKFTARAAFGAIAVGLALLALCLGGYAWASEEAGARGFNLMNEVYRIVNFLALLAILYFALRKPVKKYLAERTEKVQKALETAKLAKQRAEEQLRENEQKLASLQEELDRIRQEAELEGRNIRQRAAEEAEQLARKILEQAKSTIQLEKRNALNALHAEASLLAIELAERVLNENVGPEDHKRLVDDYLSRLGGEN